ncbi:alpha-amylase family glycosyl hydrolase [Corallincola spongiicola]|uniref:Glycosidase n=1 Tax=Corallincola spongiicola TaxID=2520508 RepID=A0ABY1WPD5_9GAMM|nr:alpha-amylase family glycosyl hydrolase [Corallincola spongiicola]TAA45808.1 glycosidase [Corallincola spongiicola]
MNKANIGGILLISTLLSACGGSSSGSTAGGGTTTPPAPTYQAYPCDADLYEQANRLRIYQVMTEAFIDGNTNLGYGIGYGPSPHEGDIQGIIDSLDYIQSLGMNAIWLTPIFESIPLSSQDDSVTRLDATGYFATNYFAIDPNFGDLEDARNLVDEAHARGIYVFFDGVFGHHKTNAPGYASPSGLTLSGQGQSYNGLASTQLSVFPTDLDFVKEVASYWIEELKIDGWRLDVANEVPVGAWGEIRQLVEQTSQSVEYQMDGDTVNPLGYMVAEIFDGSGQFVRDLGYGEPEQPGICSAFDFAMRYQVVKTLAVEESGAGDPLPSQLQLGWQLNQDNPSHAHPNLFVSNHDLVRLGDLIQRGGFPAQEYWSRHRAIYSFVAAYTGPITLYYGDEIGDDVENFDQRNSPCNGITVMCDDHVARSSGKIEGLPHGDDRTLFQASAEQIALRQYITELMQLRDQHPALYNGQRIALLADDSTGLYADLKVADSERILYLLNTTSTDSAWTVDATQLANAASLTNLLTGETVAVNGNVNIPIAALTGEFWLLNN